MPLPSSGPISLSQVQTEFGGSNPISLSEYYGVASGIPSSGTISMSQFYGASAATPFPAGTSYASEFVNQYSPEAAVAGFYYEDDLASEINTGLDLRLIKTSSGFQAKISLGHNPTGDHYGYMQDANYNETTLSNASEALMFELTSETVDALKIDWSVTPVIDEQSPAYAAFETNLGETPTATYNASDNVWQSLSTNQSIGVRFLAYTHTIDPYEAGDNWASVTANITVNIWARKTGRIDTLMATYKLLVEPSNNAIAY